MENNLVLASECQRLKGLLGEAYLKIGEMEKQLAKKYEPIVKEVIKEVVKEVPSNKRHQLDHYLPAGMKWVVTNIEVRHNGSWYGYGEPQYEMRCQSVRADTPIYEWHINTDYFKSLDDPKAFKVFYKDK